MQVMTWALARLGSRFNFLFEPHHRRVRHSALGRYLDRSMDLMVGLVEPDGTDRVLPFSQRGSLFYNSEQFERINSITFRGYSERYRLRFEFNVHGVFYPQNEQLCLIPAFYLEMRVSSAKRVRRTQSVGAIPQKVRLFIRINRPDTRIVASWTDRPPGIVPTVASRHASWLNDDPRGGQIELSYRNSLTPHENDFVDEPSAGIEGAVDVYERIVSLNPGCEPDPDGRGLTLELPVTEIGSGIKWRLVWGAYCQEPILEFHGHESAPRQAKLRYTRYWDNLDEVMNDAVVHRDDWLAHSRRFEKLVDQAPLRMAQRHLLHQGFQSFLSNTFWCDRIGSHKSSTTQEGTDSSTQSQSPTSTLGDEWFSVWEGGRYRHSAVNTQYHGCLFYLAVWPRLLGLQLDQWAAHEKRHPSSEGSFLSQSQPLGPVTHGQSLGHDLPVEDSCSYLLMLQVFCHWTGQIDCAQRHDDLIERLARYLLWTGDDGSGFPAQGTASPLDDAGPAIQYGRKKTFLAIKRLAALQAAADLLHRLDRVDVAQQCEQAVEADTRKVEIEAWLNDHYAVCVDRSVAGLRDIRTRQPLPYMDMPAWDAYTIYTGHGLLLPMLVGQPALMDRTRLRKDLVSAAREALGPYGLRAQLR